MGNLPQARVSPAPPFNTTGVDYAGPFQLKERKGRGTKSWKAYLCLFICFTTKAVHLELVSDLTTEAFLAAFRRFCARRGKPSKIHSDSGTNFTGANNELKELAIFLYANENNLGESLNDIGVSWNFIPAYSPHMGGLWEAGIKSAKLHLKRVTQNVIFTFEELSTLLADIETVLNSRPLSPLSDDPNDSSALTPAHFLIGQPLTSIPDPTLESIPISRLSRYQLVQQINQHFWKRWAQEFASELQRRTKWKYHNQPLKEGVLVVIKEDHLPPLKWMLGRIIELHPGSDKIARVTSIRTSSGIIRRSVAKICLLPVEYSED